MESSGDVRKRQIGVGRMCISRMCINRCVKMSFGRPHSYRQITTDLGYASAAVAALLLIAIGSCHRRPASEGLPDPVSANQAVVEWRAKHEADYRRDWVSVAGLHPFKPGRNTAGSARTNDLILPASAPDSVGTFVLYDDHVKFEPVSRSDVTVLLRDKPVTGPIELRDDSSRDVDELVVGTIRLVVHVSGGRRALRVRDPNGPLARDFRGFTWFPIGAGYRVLGHLVNDPAPQRLKVVNTYGDLDEYTSEGTVEFTMQGQTLRLRPFTTRPNRFYFVFRDASSGEETYETARFLYSDLQPDGTTVLDFNMAYNPPCAFNPYTTCPIPLRENRLPIKILAGERAYSGHAPIKP
jgi:uncharacterized protein